jgi:diguanylate cyclase (GGDEF)-like protein
MALTAAGTHGLHMRTKARPVRGTQNRTGLRFTRGRSAAHAPAWLLFLAGGLALGGIAAIVGDESEANVPLDAMGLLTVATIFVGLRLNRPSRTTPWRLLAVCTLFTTIGMGVLPQTGEFAVVAQTVTGVGYVAAVIGFVLLIRGRIPGGDSGAFLDAAIVTAGVAVLIWAVGFAPSLVGARQGSGVAAVYFYVALVASGTVIRMWFLQGAHRPATRLIVLLVVVSNSIFIFETLRRLTDTSAFVGAYVFAEFASLAILGAAALHPSMAILPERQVVAPRPVSRRRLLALTLALLVNPASLAIELAAGRPIDVAPYIVGGILIAILVVARLGHVLHQLGVSLIERESLMHELRRQALYDGLTLLPNRRLFADRLSSALASRSSDGILAVLLIDLDDFKMVNDSFGHEVGDALLVAVGERIRSSLREGDTAGRLGGDEFVIALRGCVDATVPARIAERILGVLAEPYAVGGQMLRIWSTIGVAMADAGRTTNEDLIRNADIAMYLAKKRGKGGLMVFEPAMHGADVAQLQLRVDLEAGIRKGELRLHYQPVVDLRSGQTVGLEALVRWLREGRLVPPAEFIPLAEASGLIRPLTDWVIDEACRTAATWNRPGRGPWVSINLTSSEMLRSDLAPRLVAALATSGLEPERLVLEITESSLLEIELARPAIERLHGIGVRIALDDFGTGYSALSYLARLPVDMVKIDRSFVNALEAGGPEEAITAAIIELSRRLGLTTIGEGIETSSQLGRLAALGCELGQGYHLARPSAIPQIDRGGARRAMIPAPVAYPAPA